MAIIQKIRTKAGLLVAIVIGFSLFAFILSDFLTKGGMLSRQDKMTIAKFGGKRILYPQFEQKVNELENILKMQYGQNAASEDIDKQARTQAWNELMQENVFDKEYNKIGLAVDDQEMSNLIEGPNPHPIIRQMFGDPQTGKINRVALSGFLQRMDQDQDNQSNQKKFWVHIVNSIYQQQLSIKFNTLISKGLYVTKLQAERQQEEMQTTSNFSYVQKPYSAVSDSIDVSEKEIKKYYKEHKEEYKQKESRDLEYVAFNITPSKSDTEDAQKWINSILPDFKEIKDVAEYVHMNSDTPYDYKDYKKGQLPAKLDSFAFNSKVGDVMGPYFEGNAFKLAKLAKIVYIPDSVKLSDIVLPANRNNYQQVKVLADSLVKLAKSRTTSFAKLAKQNSRAQSAANGGDIGWIHEGKYGQNFSDSAFYAGKGDVKITYTQDAIHVIKITDRSRLVKKVEVGVITRQITPSAKTDQLYYSKANAFAAKNNTMAKFEAATKSGPDKAVRAFGLKPLDENIQGLEKSRKLIRWAFTAKQGEVTPEINSYGEKYVVALLVKVHKKGYKPLEDVAAAIKIEVKKQKKADKLIAQMKPAASASTIDAVASKLGLNVQTASDIRFSSYAIPSIGPEPKVIAAALTIELHKVSQPIAGNNGVYILYVDNREKDTQHTINTTMAKQLIERDYIMTADNDATEIIKNMANVEDNRQNFF